MFLNLTIGEPVKGQGDRFIPWVGRGEPVHAEIAREQARLTAVIKGYVELVRGDS